MSNSRILLWVLVLNECVPEQVRWVPECSQLLDVASAHNGAHWARATGRARTPQGLVELSGGQLLLGFSAYDHPLPPHYSLPSQKGAANAEHESMGMAQLRFRAI